MAVGRVDRDETTAKFFDGTSRGDFLLRHCADCATFSQPQAEQCSHCNSRALNWETARGYALLVTWTVVHSKPRDGVTEQMVLGVAQLEEGPWWWSQVNGADPHSLYEGAPLKIEFEKTGDEGEYVPVFRLREE